MSNVVSILYLSLIEVTLPDATGSGPELRSIYLSTTQCLVRSTNLRFLLYHLQLALCPFETITPSLQRERLIFRDLPPICRLHEDPGLIRHSLVYIHLCITQQFSTQEISYEVSSKDEVFIREFQQSRTWRTDPMVLSLLTSTHRFLRSICSQAGYQISKQIFR